MQRKSNKPNKKDDKQRSKMIQAYLNKFTLKLHCPKETLDDESYRFPTKLHHLV